MTVTTGELVTCWRINDDYAAADQISTLHEQIERLRAELHLRDQEVICVRNSQSLELANAKQEIERLTAIITDRNCAIHELQDTMEWQRDKLDECRRLLREIKTAPMQIGCDSLHVSISTGLYKQIKEAAKAGGEA